MFFTKTKAVDTRAYAEALTRKTEPLTPEERQALAKEYVKVVNPIVTVDSVVVTTIFTVIVAGGVALLRKTAS